MAEVTYEKVSLGRVKGEDGKSAYQVWLDQGNTGTEAEFFEWLRGLQSYTPQTFVNYLELKELRNSGGLVAGTLYRITDYECTTIQENTSSAGHPFDIIVLALSENTLSETAYAVKRNGDNYFANSNLSAWELKYCLDNDTNRFAWADEVNGKGVIYYMKDEFGNECPYDFKNILFKRAVSFDNGYPNYDPDNGEEMWVYTFCANSYHIGNDEWSGLKDGSLESPVWHESDESTSTFKYNIIKPYIMVYDVTDEDFNKCGKMYLNNIVMFGWWEEIGSSSEESPYYYANCCNNNTFGNNCYDNNFGTACYDNNFGTACYDNNFGTACNSNTFGNYCNNNNFKDDCHNNRFGSYCSSNRFGSYCAINNFMGYCYNNNFKDDCSSNTFGNECNGNNFKDDCHNNTFGNYCNNNTFGDNCSINTFGSYCSSNTFGNECTNNTFGNNCNNNTFGDNCYSNTFGDYCYSNTFGDYCSINTFGNNCSHNRFGSYCNSNRFGQQCSSVIFGNSNQPGTVAYNNHYRYITLENGCQNLYINTDDEGQVFLQNVHIHESVSGASTFNMLTITVSQRGLSYLTDYYKAGSQREEVEF